MEYSHEIAVIAVVALCTFATRAFPFIVFGGKKELSPMVVFLGKALPPAVIAILVIYCVRNINFESLENFIPQAISVLIVGILHFWKGNNILSIGAGTVCYMVMIQLVF